MPDLFEGPFMAMFKGPRNLIVMVVRAKLDNPLANGGIKLDQTPDVFYANTALPRTVS